MLRKNELENVVKEWLLAFWSESGAYTQPDVEYYAKEIVEEIKRCLSLPT